VGLSPDDPVWDPTSFTKNRQRLQNGNVFAKLMNKNHPQIKSHCRTSTFGGRDLIEACASQTSLRPKDGSDDGDGANFHGQKRKNDTHASTSDPDVAFAKPAGREAKLSHMGQDKAYDTADHMANLRALIVTPHVTQNNGITKTGKSRRSAIDERTTRRRTDHAPPTLWHAAIAPGDDRMHLR
jgi:hypothetical protein